MCKFFSLVSDGKGKPYYFNASIRRQIIDGKLDNETDSHTSIADYYGFKGAKEDILNKWEYDVFTRVLTADQINADNDRELIQLFCDNLDFGTVVPELVVRPTVHPFRDVGQTVVTDADIELLKEWASVRDSVGASVWASVRASVGASVGASVWDSVWASVWASVRDSVGASVRDSVWAHYSTFFDIYPGGNPYQCCVNLWEKGLVPSFDGITWRLHGNDGMILHEMIIKGGVSNE